MANFCKKCGTRLSPTAKFCPSCGERISQTNTAQNNYTVSGTNASNKPYIAPGSASTQDAYKIKGSEIHPGQAMQSGANQSVDHVPESYRKPKSRAGLCAFLSVVMVLELVLIAFWKPGLLRMKVNETGTGRVSGQNTSKTGKTGSVDPLNDRKSSKGAGDNGGFNYQEVTSLLGTTGHDWEPEKAEEGGDPSNYRVASDWTTEQVAQGTLTEDNLSIRSKDGASMTIEECYLDGDTAAEIRKVPGTVDYRAGDITVPLTLYEFNANGITDDTYMTLEIPMKKSAEGVVGAGCYDPETGTIWPVSFDYDEASELIRIHATHLSTYCGFPVDNARTRNAMLAYLSYEDLWEMNTYGANNNLQKHSELMEKSAKGGSSWSVADEIVNDLGLINLPLGTGVSSLGVVGDMEGILTKADGAANTIVKNSYGTIGEIMNTMWGKAGSWGVCRRYGGPVTVVEIEDKLKSTYPSSSIERIGNGLNILNTGLSVYKILQHAKNGDTKASIWEGVQLLFDRTMAVVGERMAFPAMSVYLVGVSLFAYVLNEIYTEALNGRKQVYMKAYTKYYSRGSKGYRNAGKWRKKFVEIMKAGGGIKGVEAEIDRYVGEFWTEADNLGIDYLISVMTEDEKAAWGVAAQGGLNQDIKNEITQNYKSEIMPNLINILRVLNDKNMDEISEIYFSQYESLCRSMNQVMTIQLIDGTKEADKTSMYAGCIVRFKGLKGKVDDPKKWEVVLDNNGQGVIKCTFLAHLMVNAGDVLEVVKVEGNKERVIHEQKFKIKLPLSRVILEMPEQGVWELQGVYYVRHFQWVGKSGTSIADQWLDMSINDDATAYSYSYKDKDTAKDGKGVLPGAVVTAEQLAETFNKQIALDKAMVATLVEGIPEGYDFRNADDKSLNSFKKDTHYMFQEAGSGKESFFSTAAAVPNANGSRVLLIDLSEPGAKGFRLIYRECSSDIASGYKWQEYGVEQIDRM